jgi:hypothetical protein
MDAPITFTDQGRYFADSNLRAICGVESAAREIARHDYGENHRAQNWLEAVIEGTVDENRFGGRGFKS